MEFKLEKRKPKTVLEEVNILLSWNLNLGRTQVENFLLACKYLIIVEFKFHLRGKT